MKGFGVRGPKNPYKRVKPYPKTGPQGQMVNPTYNNGNGPQGQKAFEKSKSDTTE